MWCGRTSKASAVRSTCSREAGQFDHVQGEDSAHPGDRFGPARRGGRAPDRDPAGERRRTGPAGRRRRRTSGSKTSTASRSTVCAASSCRWCISTANSTSPTRPPEAFGRQHRRPPGRRPTVRSGRRHASKTRRRSSSNLSAECLPACRSPARPSSATDRSL